MNRGDRVAQKALRCQKQPKAQQQSSGLKKKRIPSTTPSDKDAHGGSSSKTTGTIMDTGREVKPEREKRPANVALSATTECQPTPGAQRKLSDASNASEDMSKDSGCVSGKVSSSDSSSEISDCPSEGNSKIDSPSDPELSWINGKAYVSPDNSVGEKGDGNMCTWATQDNGTFHPDAENNLPGFGGTPGVFSASGAFMTGELIMGETTEDLVREVEDLRSENEYLKDELEELRCETLEMRDMFQEEGVFQLQELRVQLEQANKMCRILHYRLRKAERRSIRVAQTGQVDGELVRTLEHDIKVAKSVSVRLHNELESVQKRSSQLEWENEGLREKTQELEVAKQVLQAELEKARESTLKRKGARSPAPSKAEKRLSQQIEDDSADLKCQLHFAKEELSLMCKKLSKLVSESESMREELTKYRSAYGDIGANRSPEGEANSAHAREAEVRVHLRLVEEEATLLSRRIVELEVENRGLRAEMSDLRERIAGGGEEEVEEPQEASAENLSPSTQVRDRDGREQGLKTAYMPVEYEQGEEGKEVKGIAELEGSPRRGNNQTQVDGMFGAACQIPREGPVGGEWDPADRRREDDPDEKGDRGLRGLAVKDYEALLALRDHSCIVSSALRLLTIASKNGHCSSPSSPSTPQTEVDPKAQLREQDSGLQGPWNEALELLQTMLLAFIGRVETILTTGGELGGPSLQKDRNGWDSHITAFLPGGCAAPNEDTQGVVDSPSKQGSVEDLRTVEVKERAKQARQGPPSQRHLAHSCRDPKMRLTLQILWVLHHWCQVKGPGLEGKEVRDKTKSVLQGLMRELGAELQDEGVGIDTEAKATQGKVTECAVNSIVDNGRHFQTDRTCPSKGKRHRLQFSSYGSNRKNWCYLSQEAAQLDREDPTKTWDHPIMPLSFPDLDLDRTPVGKSHTAPEWTALRVYYSPPSARRVQLAQLRQSPVAADTADRDSVSSASPWCTPPTSFSALCLGLSANMSDDMKEITASLRQPGRSGSPVERKTGRFGEGWAAEVTCSGTQTHTRPQMVSVGLQTDGGGPQSIADMRRSSPSRILRSSSSSSSLVSARNHHISTSLERVTGGGRAERPKPTSTSPRLYRRHSTSCSSSSFHSSANFSTSATSSSTSSSSSSSSSSAGATKERALWNLSPQSRSGVMWARTASTRAGAGHNHGTLSSEVSSSGRSIKPPSKPAGTNRCGLVTEFLRRVSGRADKPAPTTAAAGGQKGKSGLKNMERVPSRPPGGVSLNRNDSVTRIVNQRFMKQREEAGRVQKEERGSGQNQAAVRGNISRDQSLSTITSEQDRTYDCSSSSTLTFCFARPSRSAQRQQASNQSKLHRHGYAPAAGGSGDANCD